MQSHPLSDWPIFWLVLNKFYICLILLFDIKFKISAIGKSHVLTLVIILVLEIFLI